MGEPFNFYLFLTQEPVLLGPTIRRAMKLSVGSEDFYCGDSPASNFLQASKVS